MSKSILRGLAKLPALGTFFLFFYRVQKSLHYILRPVFNWLSWLFTSRETTNFTYELEEWNIHYLAAIIADVTSTSWQEVMNYIDEIRNDKALQKHIREGVANSSRAFVANKYMPLGRRLGWYAFVRILKPKIIVETGVDKGLGACVLTAALKRNAEEGYPGYYYGTDINPEAGYLLSGEYAKYGKILYGDSIESLKKLQVTIDIFINDSDHSAEYEAREYETIRSKLSSRSVILGDNSHITDKLLKFSIKHNRSFLYFHEVPRKYWGISAGIGISFIRKQKT